MPTPTLKIKTRRVEEFEIRLTGNEIADLLKGGFIPANLQPPSDVKLEIFVPIPGGGDWSHADLSIDSHTPLVIRWTRVTETEE